MTANAARFEPCCFGSLLRNGGQCRPGIDHEIDRRSIDFRTQPEMPVIGHRHVRFAAFDDLFGQAKLGHGDIEARIEP